MSHGKTEGPPLERVERKVGNDAANNVEGAEKLVPTLDQRANEA